MASRFGERPEVAYVLPLSVDGMLVVASAAMVKDKRAGRRVRWSARTAFVVGVAASVGANIAAAMPSPGAHIVAAWPAVALLLVVGMLTRLRPAPPCQPPWDGGCVKGCFSAAGTASLWRRARVMGAAPDRLRGWDGGNAGWGRRWFG
ncbi:DUF2637 domain-containing protein, partial [Rhizomonospora bruguierae]|uniref:DUF2637 domain-containing protein n=1 Tax=Rhizomonospora bruguierae TaxID=1581705 RepID=UPI0020C0CDE8